MGNLSSLVMQFVDTWIGRKRELRAMDIANVMGKQEIAGILRGKGLTGVRCGRTIACGVG